MSFALDRIRRNAGSEAIDELIKILHDREFNIELFKQMVKSNEDCAEITQDVIDRCRRDSMRTDLPPAKRFRRQKFGSV